MAASEAKKQLGKRINLLNRVIQVQDVYKEHKLHDGITDIWIWTTHIHPRFFISARTYHKYLQMNAKKELKELMASV